MLKKTTRSQEIRQFSGTSRIESEGGEFKEIHTNNPFAARGTIIAIDVRVWETVTDASNNKSLQFVPKDSPKREPIDLLLFAESDNKAISGNALEKDKKLDAFAPNALFESELYEGGWNFPKDTKLSVNGSHYLPSGYISQLGFPLIVKHTIWVEYLDEPSLS